MHAYVGDKQGEKDAGTKTKHGDVGLVWLEHGQTPDGNGGGGDEAGIDQ